MDTKMKQRRKHKMITKLDRYFMFNKSEGLK